MKLWGGRFTKKLNKQFKTFNDSLHFDYRLAEQDIIGSVSWSKILVNLNIFTIEEQNKLEKELNDVLKLVQYDPTSIIQSDAEDIHSWVEKKLIDKFGNIGKKLHTGRSRNDQVATDIKMWCKNKMKYLNSGILHLQQALVFTAQYTQDVIMPGYTHLQRAQPIVFSHWCLAYVEMLERDENRIQDTLKRLDKSPLGSGALAGTAYSINREQLAQWLGFSSATRNSLDSVSDRDYLLELLSNAAISMVHLSRFAEDIIFFNSGEAAFIELSDRVTSGSSLMPQKKNPDSLELIRGKCGRVQGALIGMMIMLKGLPLSYNKDIQEDKEGLFDALDTWMHCIQMTTIVLDNMKVNRINCKEATKRGYANATDFADYLVNKGVTFRDAHKMVGKIIVYAVQKDKNLNEISLPELKKFNTVISQDVYTIFSLQSCLDKRSSKGGVSSQQVFLAISAAKKRILQNSTTKFNTLA